MVNSAIVHKVEFSFVPTDPCSIYKWGGFLKDICKSWLPKYVQLELGDAPYSTGIGVLPQPVANVSRGLYIAPCKRLQHVKQ